MTPTLLQLAEDRILPFTRGGLISGGLFGKRSVEVQLLDW